MSDWIEYNVVLPIRIFYKHISGKTYYIPDPNYLEIYEGCLILPKISTIHLFQPIVSNTPLYKIKGQKNILNHCRRTLKYEDYLKIEGIMFEFT